jgi:hypothetical protein
MLYFLKYKLDEIYSFDFKMVNAGFFTAEETKVIQEKRNIFEKNVALKETVSEKLKTADDKFQYYEWIVKDWGNIHPFKKTLSDVNDFICSVKKGLLLGKQFDTISSYSKIVSFLEPDKYFIYDSRVAYVLDWLLLKNNTPETLYFPVPNGRNSNLKKYDIETIINLYCGNVRKDKNGKLYYDKQEAYFIYNSFVRRLYEKTNGAKMRPYYIEMMLFALFEHIVDAEVKRNLSITIIDRTEFFGEWLVSDEYKEKANELLKQETVKLAEAMKKRDEERETIDKGKKN